MFGFRAFKRDKVLEGAQTLAFLESGCKWTNLVIAGNDERDGDLANAFKVVSFAHDVVFDAKVVHVLSENTRLEVLGIVTIFFQRDSFSRVSRECTQSRTAIWEVRADCLKIICPVWPKRSVDA